MQPTKVLRVERQVVDLNAELEMQPYEFETLLLEKTRPEPIRAELVAGIVTIIFAVCLTLLVLGVTR